jgi:transcriptional regulator with XRE-family HTH domain
MKVLDNIKRIRKERGLSQEYVAGKILIHTINYGKIENGITALTIERLYEIAKILNVSVSELLGEDTQIIKENIELKAEIESLKIANTLSEHEKNKAEMAVESWEELKNLRGLVNMLEYLDYIDQSNFKKENGKYFSESLNKQYILMKEFDRFFFSLGINEASKRIKKHIDITKFETSDLIIQESKVSGWPVNKIIGALKKLQEN